LTALRPEERRFLLLALPLLAGVAVALVRANGGVGVRTAPAIVVSEPPLVQVADTLRSRETLGQLFARRGVSGVDWRAVNAAVRNFDPARLRAGQVFTFASRHGEPEPHAVVTRVSWDERMRLLRDGPGAPWRAEVERIPWRTESFVLEGEVATNVSDAITGAAGDELFPYESRVNLVYSLADVYDWVVDFSRDIQGGDRVRILGERMVSGEGETRFARVLAARLSLGSRQLYAFRYDHGDGRAEFYDETGRSMRRDLLRAPLEFRRIASGFSRSRFHPILRYRRPHNGIDFSAAYGAPIRAVGDGIVTSAGRSGGYGNLVEIRHPNNRQSRYAHLSGFAQGVHVGARVTQGQTIGYVGASGLATSAHLHYELLVNGRFVDPRRQFAAGQGQPIAASRRAGFESEMRRLLGELEPARAPQLATARVD
jgi:murein DD-endopeptidase MepM/ murein hydrolase activator NlpD